MFPNHNRQKKQINKSILLIKKISEQPLPDQSSKHHVPIMRSIVLIVTYLYKILFIKPFKNTKRVTDLQSITRFEILSFKFHCILQQKKESFYSVTPVLKIAISR
ncbi:unknown [Bacteroides sp. CAG:144]|nr:unknown [Bacteroides sp. CAG:144]